MVRKNLTGGLHAMFTSKLYRLQDRARVAGAVSMYIDNLAQEHGWRKLDEDNTQV